MWLLFDIGLSQRLSKILTDFKFINNDFLRIFVSKKS